MIGEQSMTDKTREPAGDEEPTHSFRVAHRRHAPLAIAWHLTSGHGVATSRCGLESLPVSPA